MKLSVVTPTGGRPEAFAFLRTMMARQTEQPWQWIVVDDVDPATDMPASAEVIRPMPRWQPGQNTLARNLLSGLEAVTGDAVVMMEDDDYYVATYLAEMGAALQTAPMVGEGRSRYYHVGRRLWFRHENTAHASLAATAMHTTEVPRLRALCQKAVRFLDRELWASRAPGVIRDSELVVGMKGLPGRPGIGGGHQPTMYNTRINADPALLILRLWIGVDADWYAPFYQPA